MAKGVEVSKHKNFGMQFWNLKLKLERRICCTKTLAIVNRIIRIFGTIKSSNLCTEIMQFTSKDEVAVCNLASIALPKFVTGSSFNHQQLYNITRVVTCNLNKIIDINYYPVEEAKRSNFRHRPIGIGVQGLADAFIKLRLPFDSDGARLLNKEIFETIYFAALTESVELAKKYGAYEFARRITCFQRECYSARHVETSHLRLVGIGMD